ncbi:unnamed protein product [Withania somnifera]
MACCGCSSRLPPAEEIGPLVPGPAQPANRKNRRRRRGRSGPQSYGGSSVAHNWRPSLSVISEDNALPPRNVKRKVLPASPSATQPRHRCEDTRRVPVSALAPAFSPTPFLF